MRSPTRRIALLLSLSLACLTFTAAGLALLKGLPFASARVEMQRSRPDSPPDARGFSVGSIWWDLRDFATDAKLDEYRRFFNANCSSKLGFDAAECVHSALVRAFPFGTAIKDFCDRDYDPVATLQFHLSGRSGHCMQRSALLAGSLLSVGIPVRVVQFVPYDGSPGHTATEVWDRELGWTLVDPSVEPLPLALPSRSRYTTPRPNALLAYPEPWAYLRTGRRYSIAPFRAAYVFVGNSTWRLGIGQSVLQMGIPLFGIATLVLGFLTLTIRQKATAERTPANDPLPQAERAYTAFATSSSETVGRGD